MAQLIPQIQERVKAMRSQVKIKREQVLGRFGMASNPGVVSDVVERARSRIQTVTTRAREMGPLERVKAPIISASGRPIAGGGVPGAGIIEDAGRGIAGGE